jgi:hypothetical protein
MLFFFGVISLKAQTTVTGNVKGASGEAIPGVTVLEKNTTNGSTTILRELYNKINSTTLSFFLLSGIHRLEEEVKGLQP